MYDGNEGVVSLAACLNSGEDPEPLLNLNATLVFRTLCYRHRQGCFDYVYRLQVFLNQFSIAISFLDMQYSVMTNQFKLSQYKPYLACLHDFCPKLKLQSG